MTDDAYTLAETVLNKARAQGKTIGVAESCTGGLLGGMLTAIPGSSDVFHGGIIAYDNRIKQQVLNVPSDVLDSVGAVSGEVAIVMAENGRNQLGVDLCVSITGIAGPGGGSEFKPVGLVFIGLATGECAPEATRFEFGALVRDRVREATVKQALIILDQALTQP